MKKIPLFILLLLSLITSSQAVLYNTTNLTSARTPYDQAKALNDITDNMIGIGIVLISIVITFTIVSTNNQNVLKGFGAAMFVGTFTAGIMLPLGFIGFNIFKIILLLGGVSVALSVFFYNRL